MLKKPTLSATLLVLGLIGIPLSAQVPADSRFADAREYIIDLAQDHRVPAVAVAVAEAGRITWAEGFGWADLERQIPATEQTMFALASITKPITATALLQLVERGAVHIDLRANYYLGTEKIRSYAWDPTEVTVRRLLSHTAGMPLHWQFFYEDEVHPVRTTDEGITRFGIVVSPPGKYFQYSNLGYGIVKRIIERVTGRGYGDFLQTEVFEVLGMQHTVISTGSDLGTRAAIRYDSKNRPIPNYDFDHRGASAVYASVSDLMKFALHHLGHRNDEQEPLLSDSTMLAMRELATPTGANEQGYGLGWLVQDDVYGYRQFGHTGGMPGVSTALFLYPDEDVAFAILTNKSGSVYPELARRIASVVLPDYGSTTEKREDDGRPVENSDPALASQWVGAWDGSIHTYEGSVPLSLDVDLDGIVRVRLGDGAAKKLESVSFEEGRLRGSFSGTIPTEDTLRHAHVIMLDLRLSDDTMSGSATAVAGEGGANYALSAYAELTKDGGL